jgi:hypothetical protein
LRGHGLGFVPGECRIRGSLARSAETTENDPSAIVEVFLVREGVRNAASLSQQSALWEQLRSSLSMALPLGTGLADLFPVGVTAPANQSERSVVAEALAQISRSQGRKRQSDRGATADPLALDGIAQQIRAIQELLNQLSRRSGLSVELTLAVDQPDDLKSTDRGPRPGVGVRRRRWLRAALCTTAVGSVAAGTWWWDQIVRFLGIGLP